MDDMNSKNRPIGIFDSGIGGLTVAKEIHKRLPNENIIYLGDTARVPYGNKSPRTVIAYSKSNARFLIQNNIKLLVVACNTASASAIPTLRDELSIPVIGVIEPGASKAASLTNTKKIGVIGTPSTIRSNAYKVAIEKIDPGIDVVSKPCPLFVPLADEGWTEGEVTELIAREYLGSFDDTDIDVLVLGCTHYPLLKPIIQKVIGTDIRLVDSAEETSEAVANALHIHNIQCSENKKPERQYYLTDVSDSFISVAQRFLGQEINHVEMVDIVDVT